MYGVEGDNGYKAHQVLTSKKNTHKHIRGLNYII